MDVGTTCMNIEGKENQERFLIKSSAYILIWLLILQTW